MRNIKALICWVALVCLVGCSKKDAPSFLSVGNHTFTWLDYQEQRAVLDSFSTTAKITATRDEKRLTARLAANRRLILSTAATYLLVQNSLGDRAPSVSKRARERAEKDIAVRITGKRKAVYADCVKVLADPVQRAALDRLVSEKAAVETAFEKECALKLVVTDEQVSSMWKKTCEMNAWVDETNACKRAFAQQLRQRILGGEDFGKLADELSEEPKRGEGGDWGTINLQILSYDNPGVTRAIRALKEGEITDVLDSVDGYVIYKLIRKVPATTPEADDEYQVSRIVIRPYQRYSAEDEGDIRRELERRTREDAIKDYMKSLLQKGSLSVHDSEAALSAEEIKLLQAYQKKEEKQ